MMNLWGFEKQTTLSRMEGRFGLRQTATPQRMATVSLYPDATNSTPIQTLRVPITVPRDDEGSGPVNNETIPQEQIAHVIDALRQNGTITPGQQIQVSWHQEDNDGRNGRNILPRTGRVANPNLDRDITTARIPVTPELLNGHSNNGATAPAATPPPPASPATATTTGTTDNAEHFTAAQQRANELADRQHHEEREDLLYQRQQTAQTAAAEAARPSPAAQIISSILNPIAGTMVGLGTANAMSFIGANSFGFGNVGGGIGGYGVNPLLPMNLASSFIGGNGSGVGNNFGGMDILGLGNTFYGQALDERSRSRQLDAEINRLKMMIMSGNMDAILQAVTLLTLRSKSTLRTAATAMINAMQASNQRVEEQNNRLQALSGGSGNSQSNQAEMMRINNNIQMYNGDKTAAMNSVRDMMSALEEQTSTEQGIRRGFEQLRQIGSWRA